MKNKKLLWVITILSITLSWCSFLDKYQEKLVGTDNVDETINLQQQEPQNQTQTWTQVSETEKMNWFITSGDLFACLQLQDKWFQDFCTKQAKNYIAFEKGECEKIVDHPELLKQCPAYQKELEIYKEKLTEYEKLILTNSASNEIWADKLNVLANQQAFDESISSLEKAHEENPDEVWTLLGLANIYMQKWSLELKEEEYGLQAIEYAQKVLALDDENSEAWRVIGYSNEIMEEYDAAFEAYNKAIELDWNSALAYSNRWHAYKLLWKLEEAEADFNKAYELDENLDHTLINLATIYLGRWDNQKALAFYNKVLKTSLNTRFKSEALYSIGSISIEDDKLKEAEAYFWQASEMDPAFELPYIGLAKAQFMRFFEQVNNDDEDINGNLVGQALQNLVNAININPNKAMAYYQLALIHKHLGLYSETDRFFQEALAVIPNDISLSKTEKETMINLINNHY